MSRPPGHVPPGLTGRYLWVPLEMDDVVLGVLVVAGFAAQAASPAAELHRLGELPELIASSLDRVRLLAAVASASNSSAPCALGWTFW